jgi:hypothetical protein
MALPLVSRVIVSIWYLESRQIPKWAAKHEAKLAKRAIDAVAIPETGETWLWDTELAGFFLRVRPSGRKVYAVRYRLGSQQNTFTIGVH